MTRVSPQARLEHEAREGGRVDGYRHAVYVHAYSGDLNAVPEVPSFYRPVADHYLAGFAAGVAEYR